MTDITDHVVVVTVQKDRSLIENGSGIVIAYFKDPATNIEMTRILTNRHVVVAALEKVAQDISVFVNGTLAQIEDSNLSSSGVDLVVLIVPGTIGRIAKLGSFSEASDNVLRRGAASKTQEFTALGYSKHLRAQDFKLDVIKLKIPRSFQTFNAKDKCFVNYIAFDTERKGMVVRGHSGGPIFDKQQRLVAIMTAQEDDGAIGVAIDLSTPELPFVDLLRETDPAQSTTTDPARNPAAVDAPPKPGPIVHPDDPQKSRWGGKTSKDGITLRISVSGQNKQTFWFDAIVESKDEPLIPPAIFHLHDSYPRSVIKVSKLRENGRRLVLEEVSAYGVFAIGVQVRNANNEWISLETDLAHCKGIDPIFLKR